MQRRISLTVDPEDIASPQEESAEVEAETPERRAGPPHTEKNAGHGQDIAQLFRSGIVTHQIKNPDALDPMFAISQLKDLPEVSFVAAFEDGLVLLGCPNGPPPSIAEMVMPFALQTEQINPPESIDAKLEQLNQRLDALQAEREDQLTPALTHIESISSRLEFLVDALAPDNGSDADDTNGGVTLADLDAQLKALHVQNGTPSDGALERIDNAVSELVSGADQQNQNLREALEVVKGSLEVQPVAVAAQEDHTALREIEALFDQRMGDLNTAVAQIGQEVASLKSPPNQESDAISQALMALNARFDDAPGSLAQPEGSSELIERLDALQQALEQPRNASDAVSTLQNQFDDLPSRSEIETVFETFKSELTKIAEQSEAVATQSEASITLLKRAAERDTVKTINQKLDSIAALLSDTSETNEDTASWAIALANLQEQVTLIAQASGTTTLEEGLNELRDEMRKAAAAPPSPVLDLTEQQQAFAELTTTIGDMREKLETSLDHMTSLPKDAEPAAGHADILERLERLSAELNQAAPSAPDLTPVAARLDGLSQAVAELATPVHTMADGMEALFEAGRTKVSVLKEALDQMQDHLANPPQPHVDLKPIIEHIDAVSAHAQGLPDALTALQAEVAQAAARSAPELDLTAQQESFAKFDTAMNAVVARLEQAVEHLSTAPADSSMERPDLDALVQSLPAVLQQVFDITPLHTALSEVRNDIKPLQPMPEALDALRRRSDPSIDLSDQRRSFLRFGTTLNMVVTRLENVAAKINNTRGTEIDLSPLTTEMDGIAEELCTLSQAQQETTRVLRSLCDIKPVACAPTETTSEVHLSPPKEEATLEQLRSLFAETIAAQMKLNAEGSAHNAAELDAPPIEPDETLSSNQSDGDHI